MPNFIRITPCMHVEDVPAAVPFFTDLLGFKAPVNTPIYAYVQRGNAAIRIMRGLRSPGEEIPPGNGRFLYYIDVEDIAAVHAELQSKLDAAGVHTRGPVDQPYGQREFMVTAPDGNLIVYGQTTFEMSQ
jgi:catechol 2,3-dioxygenase-like lactoylglutathione lyase family enzyme